MSLNYIMDRFAIEDTITRGCTAVDKIQHELFDQVFAADALIDYRPIVEPMDYAGFRKWAAEWAEEATENFHAWMHIISNLVIEIDGDRATVTSNLYTPMILKDQSVEHFYGRYHDTLRRTEDGWRIVHRLTEGLQSGEPSSAQ